MKSKGWFRVEDSKEALERYGQWFSRTIERLERKLQLVEVADHCIQELDRLLEKVEDVLVELKSRFQSRLVPDSFRENHRASARRLLHIIDECKQLLNREVALMA